MWLAVTQPLCPNYVAWGLQEHGVALQPKLLTFLESSRAKRFAVTALRGVITAVPTDVNTRAVTTFDNYKMDTDAV